jgi:hypothetical protein
MEDICLPEFRSFPRATFLWSFPGMVMLSSGADRDRKSCVEYAMGMEGGVFLFLLLLSFSSTLSSLSPIPLSPLSSSNTDPSSTSIPSIAPTIPIPRFVHIHIPKTGGLAVESYLTKYYPGEFILTWTHESTVAEFREKICLVVVRDPIDRFISSYQYWRYGSSLFFRDKTSILASTFNLTGAENWVPPITSIFDFVHAAGNHSHPHHDYVMRRLNATQESRTLDDSQTWGVHFRPQSSWLRGGIREKIVLIRYSSSPKLFSKRFTQALKLLSLPDVNATLSTINTSRKQPQTNATRGEGHPLPHDDTSLQPQYHKELLRHLQQSHWIKRYYQSDFQLWSQVTSELHSPEKHWMAIF